MTLDLSLLPPPAIVEGLDYEAILAGMAGDFQARWPEYDALLESDPALKLLEVAAYRELLLRQRVNDAFRATLLAFAVEADLDNLATFYGVARREDESDGELRGRVIERIKGSSTAGGAAHYRFWALSADARVKDAVVESPGPGKVRISILSKDGDGAASSELVAAVEAVITRDDVRVLTDTVTVVPATIAPANVDADIWLYPDTAITLFERLEAHLRDSFTAAAGLGWDLTTSWLIARLHAQGVQRVVLNEPTADLVVDGTTSVALGTVTLNLAGHDY